MTAPEPTREDFEALLGFIRQRTTAYEAAVAREQTRCREALAHPPAQQEPLNDVFRAMLREASGGRP